MKKANATPIPYKNKMVIANSQCAADLFLQYPLANWYLDLYCKMLDKFNFYYFSVTGEQSVIGEEYNETYQKKTLFDIPKNSTNNLKDLLNL